MADELPAWPTFVNHHFLGWFKCPACGIYSPPGQFICPVEGCSSGDFLRSEWKKILEVLPPLTSFTTT